MTAANTAMLRQLLRELKVVRGQLDRQIAAIQKALASPTGHTVSKGPKAGKKAKSKVTPKRPIGYAADRTALKRRLRKKPAS